MHHRQATEGSCIGSLSYRRSNFELDASAHIMKNVWTDRGLQPWLGSLWRSDSRIPQDSRLWLEWLVRLGLDSDGDSQQATALSHLLQSALGNNSNTINPIDDVVVVLDDPNPPADPNNPAPLYMMVSKPRYIEALCYGFTPCIL